MRRTGYILGMALLIAGAAAGMAALLAFVQGEPATLSLGSIWFRTHANSLVGFQALIENRISPALWPPLQWLLEMPAWLVLVVPGLILVLLCRPRIRA